MSLPLPSPSSVLASAQHRRLIEAANENQSITGIDDVLVQTSPFGRGVSLIRPETIFDRRIGIIIAPESMTYTYTDPRYRVFVQKNTGSGAAEDQLTFANEDGPAEQPEGGTDGASTPNAGWTVTATNLAEVSDPTTCAGTHMLPENGKVIVEIFAVYDLQSPQLARWVFCYVQPGLWAKITGVTNSSGLLRYAWSEVTEDKTSTTGAFAALSGGRSGTTSAGSLYNTVGLYPIPVNEVVRAVPAGNDSGGNPIYHATYGAKAALFRVALSTDGGSGGANPPSAAAADYTYTVNTLDGTTIGPSIAVERPRYLAVAMTAATQGWAYIANDGTLVLADAYETPNQQNCS
jgi:hypothetical protein